MICTNGTKSCKASPIIFLNASFDKVWQYPGHNVLELSNVLVQTRLEIRKCYKNLKFGSDIGSPWFSGVNRWHLNKTLERKSLSHLCNSLVIHSIILHCFTVTGLQVRYENSIPSFASHLILLSKKICFFNGRYFVFPEIIWNISWQRTFIVHIRLFRLFSISIRLFRL